MGLLHAEYTKGDALDTQDLKSYCSHCMLLAHVPVIEKLLKSAPLEK